jgi:hypothetical protein
VSMIKTDSEGLVLRGRKTIAKGRVEKGLLFLERWFLYCTYIYLYMTNISRSALCNK